MSRKSTVYDVYLNAIKEREHNFYMDMLKSEKYTDFVKSMVNAAKEGEGGVTVDFDYDDNLDKIREKWMFVKHIIKSFKHQFEYKIKVYNRWGYLVSANHTDIEEDSNPQRFYVLWSEHNKNIKQNIVKFIICLTLFVGMVALFFFGCACKPETDFVSFIIACATIPVIFCSLGYGYKFGRELYYHYFGWYLILRGIERAGF